ncbi:MAG: FtsQ-type POTRA domain-containing protein [Candidatus Paceibacterota bacterium]|jgi:hypothetical protein
MKDIPTPPRIALIKRNRKVMRLRLMILFSLLFISIIFALSYFSSYPKILINKITISGNSIIDTKDLENNVNEKLSGKYLYLFARANFLIYPHKKIYNGLIAKFPRIEKLKVTREGINTIHIEVVERAGSYLYCGLSIPENKKDIGENCYFVNNNGLIFDKAPYFSGDVYFKYYTSIKGDTDNPLGSQMFPIERFHELVRFIDGVTSLGFKPAYLVIDSKGIYSLYIKSMGSNPNPKIIFKEDNNLVNIIDNFSTAMSKKEFANEIKGKYDTLSYIDLRFKNKVLYKFQ